MTSKAEVKRKLGSGPHAFAMRRLKREAAPAAGAQNTAAVTPPPPDGEIHAFIIDSLDRRDEYGLRVLQWDLSDFHTGADGTGKVLWMHRDGSFWNGDGTPIARGVARMEGPNLVLSILRYDEKDPVAAEVKRKVDEGYLDEASARFMFDWDSVQEVPDGYDVPVGRLREASIVVLGGHPASVRVRSGGAAGSRARQLSEEDDAAEDAAVATLERLYGPGCWVPEAAAAGISAAYLRDRADEQEDEQEQEAPAESAADEQERAASPAALAFNPQALADSMAALLTKKER